MKRTTYIIIGVWIGSLMLMTGTFLYWATKVDKEMERLALVEPLTKVDLPPCKAVKLIERYDPDGASVYLDPDSILIRPTDSLRAILSIPAGLKSFLTVKQVGDTACVVFYFPGKVIGERPRREGIVEYLHTGALTLDLPAQVKQVKSKLRGGKTCFEDFHRDSLSFDIVQEAIVRNSRLRVLNAKTDRHVNFVNVRLSRLYLDLDQTQYLDEKLEVDSVFLTGSGSQRIHMEDYAGKHVEWSPQTPDTRLDIYGIHQGMAFDLR